MAIPHNRAIMVLHQEDTSTSTLPQTSACSLFVVNQLHPCGGRQDKQTLFASPEASSLVSPTIGSCVAGLKKTSVSLSAMAATNATNQLCNLSAECTCKGITVTLDNNNMWNEFFRCQTEMILTKQGRRMFPCCRFRVSGLEPFQRYTLVMDMQPVDNYRYKWSDRRWETNGKADPHIPRFFVHPDSPATGLDWMQNPVSFYRLKLTNNPLDQEGHVIVNSMHRYIPRLQIVPADNAMDDVQLDGPDVATFSFSQTEFFAVTAYQNLSITQLKINYNPFAKGFRDDSNNSRSCRPRSVSPTEKLESEVKSSKEATTLNNLKSLFAKMNASEKVTTNGDLKTVNSDGPRSVEPESPSSNMKRPCPGGLSELNKDAPAKIKRISPEKNHNDSSQQTNTDSRASKENSTDVASKDCPSEHISIPDINMEGKELSFSEDIHTSILKHTTESFSATSILCNVNETTSNTPLNEGISTILCETATLNDEKLSSEKTSQYISMPLDSEGEVKKKRADPVPLPLLALFLQQLKSKTRPSRPKLKSEDCVVPSLSDKSCNDTSVAENPSPSSLNTQLNVPPSVYPTSQTVTSSTLTCTVASTEHETASTPNSTPEDVTALPASVTCETLQLSTPAKVSTPTSEFTNNVNPNTSFLDTTPDANIDSDTLDDISSDPVPTCDTETFPANKPDSPHNEFLLSDVTTGKSATVPEQESSTIPCLEPVPEAVPRSPSPGFKILLSPSIAPSSPYMSAPSSPDPFPPSMFSDRPIPPRKTLDPFPPCIDLNKPRPLLEVIDPLPQIFFTSSTLTEDPEPAVLEVTSKVSCSVSSPEPCSPKELKPSAKTSQGTKCKEKQKNGGKSKLSEETEMIEGPIPVPLQPNLEDVEGQLFVSFMSKKALEIHLGDDAKEDMLQKTTAHIENNIHDEKERIDENEKALLRDLKHMKYRQVIHPVLQAVGLKLNLLDVTLSIDLQYLGVCLPIPPPEFLCGDSSETCSSQAHFVSRTGKTTDITKIKGWREKFSKTSSSVTRDTTPSEAGQKNLSAFCSDMLDEYLESEGKLIDERAASFSQAVVTPVAYQMPTKSTSYVRTLDSVLKKQALPLSDAPSKTAATSKTTVLTSKKMKKSVKSVNPVSSKDKKSGGKPSKKSTKAAGTSKSLSSVPSAAGDKKSPKIKTKKASKTSQHSAQTAEKSFKDRVSVAHAGPNTSSNSHGSNLPVGRSSSLPKTLVKLRDVEDGAVWEGKKRTYITLERAAIALSCLVTAEGTIGGSPSTVIKRRAPPCLNDFCRLGCVCASLVQERRQHHCGKPECMLGCNCLRRKVFLLKNEDGGEGSTPLTSEEENGGKVKKKKNRISYILSGPEAAPEPAFHVKKLWVQKNDLDSEQLYIPYPVKPVQPQPVSLDLQKENRSPKREAVDASGSSRVKNQETLDCARVRPFCGRKPSPSRQVPVKEVPPIPSAQEDSPQDMEEGELRPPTQSGPTKRLEIVSNCKWTTEASRNNVLRILCEHMAQGRLNKDFWIGKYYIQATSRTIKETDEGSIITHKVVISQPQLDESEEKKRERIKQLEAQLVETIGKSEVKGLPLLSRVTPAGLLKAEKKTSGTPGQIMVNGKLYPQAKLELGQMGALHPANRLAAYITGRVYVNNKHDTKANTTAAKTSNTAPTTPTNVATTTVTSTIPKIITLDKPTVVKTHMSIDPVQVESNCENSQEQKTASTNTNLIIPSTSLLTGSTGISVSPNMPAKSSLAYHAPSSSGTTDGAIRVVKAVPASGSPASDKKYVLSNGSHVVLPGSGIRLMQPVTSTRPTVPGQKMVLLKATNPGGQVFHLLPLDQFKTLGPNVVVRPQQSTFLRLPTPGQVPLSKPQTSTTVASSTTAPSHAIQNPKTPDTLASSSTSRITKRTVTTISHSKTILLCNKSSAVKVVPGFVRDAASNTLRIVPQKAVDGEPKIVKDPKTTCSVSPPQSSSEGHFTNPDLELTSQGCLTTKNQDPRESDNLVNASSTPTKESCEDDYLFSKMLAEDVVFADHCYTFEMRKMSTPFEKSVDVSKDSSDSANSSESHTVLNEVEVDSDSTELTDDSDMYNDTDSSHSSDEDDRCIATNSDGLKKSKRKQKCVYSQVQDNDEELVDIETCEEGPEKSSAPRVQMKHDGFHNQSSDEENEILLKIRKRTNEKKRRIRLRKFFHNLQKTLKLPDGNVPKIALLTKAREEILCLVKRRDCLVKTRDRLRKKRADYIEMVSHLSGKSRASIYHNLHKIAKKKPLESDEKTNDARLSLKKKVPKQSQRKDNTKQKKMDTGGKSQNLSINKEEQLEFQEQRTENVGSDPKITAAKTSQQAAPPNAHPSPQLRQDPQPIPVPRERTRPNILSRKTPQTLVNKEVPAPQLISVVGAVKARNQIITISNPPIQPTDISSLGERQSTTPGVAAVSISIPPISHPLCVENPFPTKVSGNIRLPKISSVVSLVQPEMLLVTPTATAASETQAPCNTSAGADQQNPSSNEATLVEGEKHVDKQIPEVVPKKPKLDGSKMEADPKRQKEDENTPKAEQDDDRLMSLLDELVFLNQTAETQRTGPNLAESGDVLTELLTNKEVDLDRDDERSLSPLFLKLDEDLMSSPASKEEEIDDIPPKVADLVNVIFGSESPPNSSESAVVAAVSADNTPFPVCIIKNDALTPPPLLQMKTGGCAKTDSPKEQPNLSWRPMPKLAPLGLKTQDTGHPKLISPHVPKSDSKLPHLHSTHL